MSAVVPPPALASAAAAAAAAAARGGSSRKGSGSTHGRTDSNASIAPSSPKAHSRQNSGVPLMIDPSSAMSSPRQELAQQQHQDNSRSPSFHSTNNQKRRSPSAFIGGASGARHNSPKFPKHEYMPREISDVRNSPHQVIRPRTTGAVMSTPPMQNEHDYSMARMGAASLVPSSQQDVYAQQSSIPQNAPPGYVPQPERISQQLQEQEEPQPNSRKRHIRPSSGAGFYTMSRGNFGRDNEYAVPNYEPPNAPSSRQLPMAPPLTSTLR